LESPNKLQAELEKDSRWQLTLRVANSPYFQKAPRLNEFLLYVCEKRILNRPEEAREQQIGRAVFGRPVNYNSSSDNIVRVQARELRKRLEDFFNLDGKEEQCLIVIPRGTYLPEFQNRQIDVDENVKVEPSPEEASDILPPVPPQIQKPRVPLTLFWLILLAAGMALLILLFWQFQKNHQLRKLLSADPYYVAEPEGIWAQIIDAKHQTCLVFADSCLVLFQEFSGREVGLEEYLSKRYYEGRVSRNMELMLSRQYTNIADVNIISRILQLNYRDRDKIRLRFSRNMQLEDFKTNHVVLLGSRLSNPWVELFNRHRNFQFSFNRATGKALYRNLHPQKGEQPEYYGGGLQGTSDEAYAVIAFLPNLGKTGNILMLEATSGPGTEGAGDFLSRYGSSPRLREYLGMTGSNNAWPYFEILLKIRTLGGSTQETLCITHRILSPQP